MTKAQEEKVKFGFEEVHAAVVEDGFNKEDPKWETPFKVPGAVAFSPEVQQELAKFFADNRLYFSKAQTSGYEGDLEMAKFPDEVHTKILGNIVAANGGVYDVDGAIEKDFALMAQVNTDVGNIRVCYYLCTGGKPSESFGTLTEGAPEIKTETMKISCASVRVPTAQTAKKVYAFIYKLREGDTGYDTFFNAVPFAPPLPASA